jgi:hypothetical protein
MTLIWPLPALLTWALAWALFLAGLHLGLDPAWAFAAAALAVALLAIRAGSWWRRVFMAVGFPLSAALDAGLTGALPAWLWLLPLAALLLIYPMRSWRDAPLFPTPSGALSGLAHRLGLPDNPRIVDAGCGLGAGLIELHREWPQGRLQGWEWSWPVRWLCGLRCGRFARISRTDIWATSWAHMDLVYLFQRPESMDRALLKAQQELRPGSWLASLEFEATGWQPHGRLDNVPGKPVWLYRVPLRRRTDRPAAASTH